MSETASLDQLRLGTGISAAKREEIIDQSSSLAAQRMRLLRSTIRRSHDRSRDRSRQR